MSDLKKLSTAGVVLVIFSVVFGFNNSPLAFYRMGYASILWYLFAGVTFFLPVMFMVAEYASSFKNSGGGMYTWLAAAKGELYGFVGAFIFYFAFMVWMITVSIKIWIPMSSFLFGEDTTQSWSVLGLSSTQTIGVLAVVLMLLITFFATRGFNKISFIAKFGGIANAAINCLLYLASLVVLVLTGGEFAQPIEGVESFFCSPNPQGGDLFFIFGFITFALFAYAGPESLGSLVEKTKSTRAFSRGILISALFIAFGYSFSIFCWGISHNWSELFSAEGVNMGNVLYVMMGNLGHRLGIVLGLSAESALSMGVWFARAVGFSVFMTYMGAFFTIIYSPLKTILDGAPQGLWPKFFSTKNRFDMPHIAMWIQTGVICFFVLIFSFGGQGAKSFYNILILLANVAQTMPYLFISAAFPAFRKNSALNHEYTLFKSRAMVYLAAGLVFFVDLLANIFIVIHPILAGESDAVYQVVWMVGGPILFFLAAVMIFYRYKRRSRSG